LFTLPTTSAPGHAAVALETGANESAAPVPLANENSIWPAVGPEDLFNVVRQCWSSPFVGFPPVVRNN
jgi:hypothetical protein